MLKPVRETFSNVADEFLRIAEMLSNKPDSFSRQADNSSARGDDAQHRQAFT